MGQGGLQEIILSVAGSLFRARLYLGIVLFLMKTGAIFHILMSALLTTVLGIFLREFLNPESCWNPRSQNPVEIFLEILPECWSSSTLLL